MSENDDFKKKEEISVSLGRQIYVKVNITAIKQNIKINKWLKLLIVKHYH